MSGRSFPLYLTEEQHAAIRQAAELSGSSMTEVVRGLIDVHLVSDSPPTDLTPLIGAYSVGHPTDVGAEKDTMLEDALSALR